MLRVYQAVELNIVCIIVVTVAVSVEVSRLLLRNRRKRIIWSMLPSCDVGVRLGGLRR